MNEVVEKVKNKGGRPRKGVDVNSPEFKAAVDAAAAAATQRVLEGLALARNSNPDGDTTALEGFAKGLALSFAELADQGSNRKRVAPEIVARREAARSRMFDLLIRGNANGWPVKPEYRVVSETYLNEQLVKPYRSDPATKKVEPVEIFWTGAPNECMRPLNEPAREIYEEYMLSIGGPTVVAKNSKGETLATDGRAVTVTPGGLIIKGQESARRTVSNLADSNNANPFNDSLGMKGFHNDPRATEVHVLGTVAPPAKQNSIGA